MTTRAATERSRATGDDGRSGWALAALIVGLGWLVFSIVLLIRGSTPTFRSTSDPFGHLVLAIVLSLMVAGWLVGFRRQLGAALGWYTIAITAIVLIGLELLQIPAPGRSWQLEDLAYGSTGALVGATAAVVATRLAGRAAVLKLIAIFGATTLASGVTTAILTDADRLDHLVADRAAACAADPEAAAPTADGWQRSVLRFDGETDRCVATTIGPMVHFGGEVGIEDQRATFDGGGLASAPLGGLRSAVTEQAELTFGARFRLPPPDPDSTRPSVIARLQIGDDPARPVAHITRRGPHLGVGIGSGRPLVGVGLGLTDGATDGVHEVVVTYAGGTANAYLDGVLISTATSTAFDFDLDDELTLDLGRRRDELWQPFDGEVEAVLIAARNLDGRQRPDGPGTAPPISP